MTKSRQSSFPNTAWNQFRANNGLVFDQIRYTEGWEESTLKSNKKSSISTKRSVSCISLRSCWLSFWQLKLEASQRFLMSTSCRHHKCAQYITPGNLYHTNNFARRNLSHLFYFFFVRRNAKLLIIQESNFRGAYMVITIFHLNTIAGLEYFSRAHKNYVSMT